MVLIISSSIFFKTVVQNLKTEMFLESNKLYVDCSLEEINTSLAVDENTIIININNAFNTQISTVDEARKILEDNRYSRLQHLIDKKFTDEKLISLLECFKERKDADIVYEYDETKYYPKHSLLLEATLTDGSNQRRTEMEPVSRHLGNHLIKTNNNNSYCVFATNVLNINVIADFRARKNTPYYNPQDYSQSVSGMKIIPLQTSELKEILRKKN